MSVFSFVGYILLHPVILEKATNKETNKLDILYIKRCVSLKLGGKVGLSHSKNFFYLLQ